MTRRLYGLGRLALASLICVSSCSAEGAKDAALDALDWLDRILPVPEAPKPGKLPKDVRPIRPPLLEVDHAGVKYAGRTLPFPGLASEWAEALGPYQLRHAAPADLGATTRPIVCFLWWDELGVSAAGRWLITGEGKPACMIRDVEVLVDAKETSLMHPLDFDLGKYRPKHDFRGTLTFEGIRVDKHMEWTALDKQLRIVAPDLECPWTTSTSSGPRIEMSCQRKGTNRYFDVLLVRPFQGEARRVLGLHVYDDDPND